MSEPMNKFLEKNRNNKLRIDCVGDAMVDQYYKVSVNRISPEFPMPIMRAYSDKPQCRPGGVANVAHQFRHFEVDVQLFCFTDRLLNNVLKDHDLEVAAEAALNVQGWGCASIPVKRRFLDGDIQVTRLDFEQENYGLKNNLGEFCRIATDIQLGSDLPDVVILSDYNKGYFTLSSDCTNFLIIEHLNSHGVPTIVDPKAGPVSKWKGCTVFKPNAKEAEDLTGETDWRKQAEILQNELACKAVVITHSGSGVVGIWDGKFFEYSSDKKVDVKSSVGAGDCFVAFLAMAIGHGFEGREAVEIAYEAGAIYVQRNLNRPITPAELTRTKIVNPQDLANRDYTLAFTNGCFNILHDQHIELLKFSKRKGEKLVVALNSDESVKRLKGDRPVKALHQRMKIMAAFEFVDFVTAFDEDTPLNIIKQCKPNCIIKGGDYRKEDVVGYGEVQDVHIFPYKEGVSSTLLIEEIAEWARK